MSTTTLSITLFVELDRTGIAERPKGQDSSPGHPSISNICRIIFIELPRKIRSLHIQNHSTLRQPQQFIKRRVCQNPAQLSIPIEEQPAEHQIEQVVLFVRL